METPGHGSFGTSQQVSDFPVTHLLHYSQVEEERVVTQPMVEQDAVPQPVTVIQNETGSPEQEENYRVEAPKPKQESPEPGYPYLQVGDGRLIVIKEEKLVFGKHEDCHVVLTSQGISEKHAAIEKTKEGILLTDLGSTNGTFETASFLPKHSFKRETVL